MKSNSLGIFLFWLGVTPKSGSKVKKGGMKVEKITLTQVLIELQQKIFTNS